MPFTYHQSTGLLGHNGLALGKGYSGHGEGVGPIPCGTYRIDIPSNHPDLGPVAMHLTPYPMNEMFGRSGFFMRAGKGKDDRSASEVGIVMDRKVRGEVAAAVLAEDNVLEVVE